LKSFRNAPRRLYNAPLKPLGRGRRRHEEVGETGVSGRKREEVGGGTSR
jgi:hypothetical protein